MPPARHLGFDLITLMQSDDSTKDLVKRPMEFLGNLALLIVGGMTPRGIPCPAACWP